MNDPNIIRAIEKAFYAFLKTYFSRRDVQQTHAYFSNVLTGFGSSKDEFAYDLDAAKQFFDRDITQAPEPVKYNIDHLKITAPNDTTGFVTCVLSISTVLHKQGVAFNHMRYTLAFIKEDGAWKIAQKHLSFPSSITGEDEGFPLKELEARYRTVKRLVDEKTEALEQALKKITELANTDTLTGLPNRYHIESRLETLLQSKTLSASSLAIIMIDFDNFKEVNDTYGHLKGDAMLKTMAKRLSTHLDDTNNIGRWGGEEFLVLCPDCDQIKAMQKAEAMRRDLCAGAFDHVGRQTASFGVATYHVGDTVESIIMRGDRALYEAKRRGKNIVVCYET